jgi:hypothetical protein
VSARDRIDAFLRSLTWRHRALRALRAMLGQALGWAVAVLLVALVAAPWWPAAAAVAVAAVVGAGGAAALRRPSLVSADRELGLADRLLTYAGLRAQREVARPAMRAWFEADLDRSLAAIPAEQCARVGWRGLGRIRYAIPLLVLLLLMRLLAPTLPPIAPSGPRTSERGSSGGRDAPGPGNSRPQPPDAAPNQPPPAAETEPSPPPGESPSGPPAPLLTGLGAEDALVVPEFIGEGEGRRARARSAEIGDDAAGGGRPPQGVGRGEAQPAPRQRDYEQAREQALRARHVPENERQFVRRYFEALVQRR